MFESENIVEKDNKVFEIENLCRNLFKEWFFDLNYQEKEVWLWNALVEMARIKQRRRQM
ncbi:MAG: hypothetical protein PHS66_06870 [Candidatus Omnitrophica bacterium]|nr:hypothetical protein [Candidatus Omnitrophota bacterium]